MEALTHAHYLMILTLKFFVKQDSPKLHFFKLSSLPYELAETAVNYRQTKGLINYNS